MTDDAANNEKKKPGRPAVNIGADELRKLAALQHTYEELAFFFNCSKRTIIRKMQNPELLEAYELGKAGGRASLRRLQWRHAQMPNAAGVQMTIHLSKHWLGETDKSALELSGRVDATVEVKSARERVNRKLDALSERIARRVAGIAAQAGAETVPGEPVGS
jgi:hypothetical protein